MKSIMESFTRYRKTEVKADVIKRNSKYDKLVDPTCEKNQIINLAY
jgi:hypothetical protein